MGSWSGSYWHMSPSGCFQGRTVLEQAEREGERSVSNLGFKTIPPPGHTLGWVVSSQTPEQGWIFLCSPQPVQLYIAFPNSASHFSLLSPSSSPQKSGPCQVPTRDVSSLTDPGEGSRCLTDGSTLPHTVPPHSCPHTGRV